MSDKTNDGGLAFPQSETDNGRTVDAEYGAGGMTLRDYFAAKAMPALIAEWDAVCRSSYNRIDDADIASPLQQKELSQAAYSISDAMLNARKQ